MKLLKKTEAGKTYNTDKSNLKILYRNKGSVAGDNNKNPAEEIYLITGTAEVTLKNETWEVEPPAKVEFPAKTYHRIKALTDISFIVFEV